ncbi:DUF4031 domain-containing protein [Pedococcus sp. KACC 23699]|uniref:DUF4031 domain-containing protein n=1 Tax=Pedococcus sp. KACC 23699 TaxID=3149228 RepID=A0AAU7JYD6_9MICO
MSIWIDPPAWPAHGRLWSHLISDTSYAELHDFAAAQGIPRRGFEGDHYDVPQERYAALVAAGAQEVPGKEIVRILQRSGLRIQKRKHEKVIHSVPEASWLPPGSRADVISSRQAEPPASTVVVRLALVRGPELLVLQRLTGGLDLPSAPVGALSPQDALGRLLAVVAGQGHRLDPELLGYVRNTVPVPDADYPWPAPKACFALWHAELGTRDDLGTGVGRWVRRDEAAEDLGERHWWPLVTHLQEFPR